MADWPTFSDEDHGGRIGVNLVGLKVHKLLRWIFRETASSDIGLDGEIEVRHRDKTSHGRLISVQVKCGHSFLSERGESGYRYRGSLKHLRYWLAHTTPVIVVLCDPDQERCWWQVVDPQLVAFHQAGWSLEVPFANEVVADSISALERIANRFQKKDIVDLLLRDWLGWSFRHQIRLANMHEVPRDYHWLSLLGAVGNEFVMIDYLMADISGFDDEKIREMLHWARFNHDQYGYDRFLLAFVAERLDLLDTIPQPEPIPGLLVQFVPLLLDMREAPSLNEVGRDRRVIAFYENGETLDDWVASVERNIKEVGP
jgi:hypothetical protein